MATVGNVPMAGKRSSAKSQVRACVFAFAVSAAVAMPASSFAAKKVYQPQRYSNSNVLYDGSKVTLSGDLFSPANNACVIFATLATSSSSTTLRQLETGVVRCLNASIDGTCNNVKFVERYTGGTNYFCYPHGSFSNAVQHDFEVRRSATYNYLWKSFIDGIEQESLTGWDTSTGVFFAAWGEGTGTVPYECVDWDGDGTFVNWKKSVSGTYSLYAGSVFDDCLHPSAINGSNVFHVKK